MIVALAAQAQDRRGPGRGQFAVPTVGFTTLDINGDGIRKLSEVLEAANSLVKLDKNMDGQITSDEVRLSMHPGRGRGGPGRGTGRRAN